LVGSLVRSVLAGRRPAGGRVINIALALIAPGGGLRSMSAFWRRMHFRA